MLWPSSPGSAPRFRSETMVPVDGMLNSEAVMYMNLNRLSLRHHGHGFELPKARRNRSRAVWLLVERSRRGDLSTRHGRPFRYAQGKPARGFSGRSKLQRESEAVMPLILNRLNLCHHCHGFRTAKRLVIGGTILNVGSKENSVPLRGSGRAPLRGRRDPAG